MLGRRNHFPLVGLCTIEKDPVLLKNIKIRVLVKGFIAEVTSDLQYKNQSDRSVEASFTFPLDDDRFDGADTCLDACVLIMSHTDFHCAYLCLSSVSSAFQPGHSMSSCQLNH